MNDCALSLGEVNSTAHENSSNNNHIQLQGKKNNSTETDHASMPLGIIASKLVSLSDWQIRPTATHHSLKKAAFTLAEVLITLGIIGVVAALTLPTLIQNHQKQVYVTQLKKAYSTLNNAINNLAAQQGVTEWSQIDWGADSNEVCGEETKFFDCMGNYLFSCSNCTTEVQSLKFLANQMKAVKYKPVGRDCSAEFYYSSVGDSFCKASTVWITPDGMTFLFLVGSYTMAYIDVNGTAKGPNIGGRDVFLLFAVNGNKLTPDGILSSQADEWKNCSATNLSTSCTAKVLIEGKMNY